MEFSLNEEQRMLQESVFSFLDTECPLEKVRKAAESDETHIPDIWSRLTDLGIPGILIPEDHGGVGLGYLEAALVAEAMGQTIAPIPFVASSVMAPTALLAAGSDEQKDKWLGPIAAGEVLFGVGVTEQIATREDSGVDASADGLQGKSMFVLDGMDANMLIIVDREGALHLVDATAKGVSRRRLVTIDRTRSVAEVVFEGAAAEILPGSASDREPLLSSIDAGRLILAADSLGAAQTMLNKSVEYAKERKQFNRVIGSFQAVKHMCADMAADLEPCRSLVWYAAHAANAIPEEARLMACHAKAHLSEIGQFVARKSTEVHGGMGFTDLLGLHYWFKRIGFNRQLLGAPELVREEAASIQGWV
jgi:alkylation response protein AidB-like acyl-CoA dehydrogenase|tara:strand:- start:8340 stop:9428 length:1089 start_codon:yes stop_codon:yes gene_type:complete